MINVLLVEDDPMVAKFNARYLETLESYIVKGHAKTIEEAKDFYGKEQIDLILLDVYLEKELGVDLLSEIRKENLPIDVIMITAANDTQTVKQALNLGAVDYLIKPFTYERFKEALQQYAVKHQSLKNNEQVTQTELDTFLLKDTISSKAKEVLPKGLTKHTLQRVIVASLNEKGSFSAHELAHRIGISRVSTRKYLNYLAEHAYLTLEVSYQERGRPLSLFKVNPVKEDILQAYLK